MPSGSQLTTSEIVLGTVVFAVTSGTASKISGGKFANGAQTGAFQYLFNQASKSEEQLLARTTKLGYSIAVPSSVVEFFGGDSAEHDVELEFGIVSDMTGDAGLYFSYSGSEGYGRNRSFGIELGTTEGNILDFSGTSSGITFMGQEFTIGQNGNYGLATGLKVTYSYGGIVTTTNVVSYRTLMGNAKQVYGVKE